MFFYHKYNISYIISHSSGKKEQNLLLLSFSPTEKSKKAIASIPHLCYNRHGKSKKHHYLSFGGHIE